MLGRNGGENAFLGHDKAIALIKEVVFAEVHAEGRGLVGTIAAPSASSADAITRDFMEFVRARAEARSARHG